MGEGGRRADHLSATDHQSIVTLRHCPHEHFLLFVQRLGAINHGIDADVIQIGAVVRQFVIPAGRVLSERGKVLRPSPQADDQTSLIVGAAPHEPEVQPAPDSHGFRTR